MPVITEAQWEIKVILLNVVSAGSEHKKIISYLHMFMSDTLLPNNPLLALTMILRILVKQS